ncbi:putative hydrolase/acyltransferase (alpha/beta hydrolase superfamily) [Handroanthus impetiginosus]|uniref:Putative hydrolase/acyltransferase (Alpha/beta hydrolase superfamily) n=1 Tax=Handroanthus impetiginosus TaxID=429701 RepID=A0A2G9H0N5_9LAMI|nr:putative hydrolase/acyltransferase (alpha/beta hydrolase superfamily) [Handroanthus impetiginosus]
MEVISCHASHHCYVVNFRGVKDINLHQSKFPRLHGKRLFYFFIESGSTSSKYSDLDSSLLKRRVQYQSSRTVCSLQHVDSSVIIETYNAYVLDGEDGQSSVIGRGRSVPKVSIPSFPDEDNGDDVASISSCFWEWKPKLTVHYETSGSENVGSPAVLFLPGFGVGSFHYQKQLKDLGRDYITWALDFLGQGLSLPCEDPTFQTWDGNKRMLDGESNVWGFGDESETWAKELVFSVDLWRDQVRHFIEEVIKEPVYLVGNSLGGFVALYFAACNPELVKGVTLLNATPFWGFLPNPERSPRLSRLFPWAGTFPFPSSVRKLIEVLWQKISDPRSITEILKQVYVDHSTKVDKVFSRIIETTQHPAAAASFASIIFAPQGQLSFRESLTRSQMNNTPICLMYGKEDPWVRPVWGLQVKRQVPDAPYYEISPAGHCPHDEVPEVVNFLLRGWIQNLESNGSSTLPLLDGPESVDYDTTKDLEFIREGSRKLVRVHFHGSKFSIWNWLSSNFIPLFKEITH